MLFTSSVRHDFVRSIRRAQIYSLWLYMSLRAFGARFPSTRSRRVLSLSCETLGRSLTGSEYSGHYHQWCVSRKLWFWPCCRNYTFITRFSTNRGTCNLIYSLYTKILFVFLRRKYNFTLISPIHCKKRWF